MTQKVITEPTIIKYDSNFPEYKSLQKYQEFLHLPVFCIRILISLNVRGQALILYIQTLFYDG